MKLKRHTITVFFALLLAILNVFAPLAAAEEVSNLIIGYTGSVFQDVSSTDIKASVRILLQKVAWTNFSKSEAKFYESLSEIATDLKKGKLTALGLPPEEYMALRKMAPIEPLLITATSGANIELLLVVRKDSGIRTIHDLMGKSLVMPRRNPICPNLYVTWLETLLRNEENKDIRGFLSSVVETSTESKVVLPVYFRKADACVVTRQVYNLTTELNPQLSKELLIISHRENLIPGVIAVDSRLSREFKNKITHSFMNLLKTVEGKQLLMLFKVNDLIPFDPSHLKGTEVLYAEYYKLIARKH